MSYRVHLAAFAACVLAGSSAVSIAQPEPCDGVTYPHAIGANPCPSIDGSPAQSTCFLDHYGATGGALPLNLNTGWPLNLDLWVGPSMGDFPPRTRNVAASSSVLLPSDYRDYAGAVPFAERSLVTGNVDLVSGAPLLQETDFVLPFGSAVFRHTRTYSEAPNYAVNEYTTLAGPAQTLPQSLFWDWQGQGWMMGESPIFLFDAAYRGWSSDSTSLVGRRCYFIPDAHHAIPFDLDVASGNYSPPSPRFDAVMTHNGTGWNSANRTWQVPPTEVTVWLNRRSVRYNILLKLHDVQRHPGSGQSAHDLPVLDPNTKGYTTDARGVPYYGLVTSIEDRNRNRIEINYCDFDQSLGTTTESGCGVCYQNCNEKGQISTVVLKKPQPTGTGMDTVWTLVYTYRSFLHTSVPSVTSPGTWPNGEAFMQHALHAIHVYQGVADGLSLTQCRTLSGSLFWSLAESSSNALGEMDLLDDTSLPSDWVIRAKYLYTEVDRDQLNQSPEYGSYRYDAVYGAVCPDPYHAPRLIKASITKRMDDDQQATTDTTLYRYNEPEASEVNSIYGDLVTLGRVLRNETVNSILNAFGRDGQAKTVNDLILMHSPLEGPNPQDPWDPNDPADDVPFLDPVTSLETPRNLADCADLSFVGWSRVQAFSMPSGLESDLSAAVGEFVDFAGGDRMVLVPDGERVIGDRDPSDGSEGFFTMYRFVIGPSQYTPTYPTWSQMLRSVYHYPYRLAEEAQTLPATGRLLTEIQWIAIVDEHASWKDAEQTVTSGNMRVPLTRRIVCMNAAGEVLRERIYRYTGTESAPVRIDIGMANTYIYDDSGRLTEHRTKGWDSPDNRDPINPQTPDMPGATNSDGLIWVFGYDSTTSPEIARWGYKLGRNNDTLNSAYWFRLVKRGIACRPDLITLDLSFEVPIANGDLDDPENLWDEPGAIATWHTYKTDGGQTPATEYDPIREHDMIRRGSRRSVDGSSATVYHPIERTTYNEFGALVWRAYGSVTTPNAQTIPTIQSAVGEMHCDYTQYDDRGRPRLQVNDYSLPWTAPATCWETVATATPPTGYERVDPTTPALNYSTETKYCDFGIDHVKHQNGRYTLVRYREFDEPAPGLRRGLERWVYRDAVPQSESCQSDFDLTTPAERTIFYGGQIAEVGTFRMHGVGREGVSGETLPPPLVTMNPRYDFSGRLDNLDISQGDNPTQPTLSATIAYDGFGGIARQRDPDGTVTRTLADHLGRPWKIYRGTNDNHDFWNLHPDPPDQGENMVLLEKRAYSNGDPTSDNSGARNAGELVSVRYYREKPEGQYGDATTTPPNNEDQIGWLEEYRYDWMMRPVVTVQKNSSGVATQHTATFLDVMGRVRFVATFGSQAPSGDADPTTMGIDCVLPTAAEILAAAGQSILALSETRYNDSGLVEETREFKVDDSSGASYLSTRTIYDYTDRPLAVVSPNGNLQRYTYDALGREVTSSTFAYTPPIGATPAVETELLRTETTFDPDGFAIGARSLERTRDREVTNDNGLLGTVNGNDNYVASFSFNWYSLDGRLTTTVNLGANNSHYRTGPSVPTRPDTDPVSFSTGSAVYTAPASSYHWATAGFKMMSYRYDDAGRQSEVWAYNSISGAQPWVQTKLEYDGLGQLLVETRNANSSDATQVQQTAYRYTDGQLTNMAAVLPGHQRVNDQINWDATDGTLQISRFEYDADVIDPGTPTSIADGSWVPNVISRNRAWISKVFFPDPDPVHNGVPNSTPDLTFQYYPDGLLATRKDARATVFTHLYDERANRTQTFVKDLGFLGVSPLTPIDSTNRIDTEFDALDRPISISNWTIAQGSGTYGTIISEVELDYDKLGNLLADWQAHGETVRRQPGGGQPASQSVQYSWNFASAAGATPHNRSRLNTMQYPAWLGVTRQRTLTFDYGTGSDSALSRVVGITDSTISGRTHAAYAFAGASRRVMMKLGRTGTSPFSWAAGYDLRDSTPGFLGSDTIGFPCLDPFARLKYFRFTRRQSSVTAELGTYLYSYDSADNRISAKVNQHAVGATQHLNDRSSLYAYDRLDRLVKSEFGAINSSLNGMMSSPVKRQTEWILDTLGNWNGGPQGSTPTPGVVLSGDVSIPPNNTSDTQRTVRDITGPSNRLEERRIDEGGTSPSTADLIFNRNGNLVSDGTFLYQYDAFNRLVQINHVGGVVLDGDGEASGTPGAWVVHYTYDGLGRLIRKQVPWNYNRLALRAERYFYDGVRRVHELFSDPKPGTVPESINPGDPLPNPPYITTTQREYIWAPGGAAPGYVDELVCQITSANIAEYVLQDSNYNVVALVSSAGQVLSQFAYDPYGEPIVAEQSVTGGSHADLRVGHQGLFLDRLDLLGNGNLDVASGGAGPNWTIAAPAGTTGSFDMGGLGHKALYQNRNRSYSSRLGRFLQSDPFGTGLPLQADEGSWHAESLLPAHIPSISGHLLFTDGSNRYQYQQSRVTNATDPSGLFMGIIGGLSGAAPTLDLYSDYNDEVIDTGRSLQDWIMGPLAGYAFDQYLDYGWASNWDEPDDLYRGSAGWADGTGSWAGMQRGAPEGGPAVAAGWTDKLVDLADEGAKGIGIYLVYDGDEIIYAGRSVNLKSRMATQLKAKGGSKVVGIVTNCKDAARAMEDLFIRHLDPAKNVLNGISDGNKKKKQYYNALKTFMSKLK